jgi:hypothetical protein
MFLVSLACREILDRHTAINIKEWLRDVCDEYEIKNNQILSAVSDNARNITKALDHLNSNLNPDQVATNFNITDDIDKDDDLFDAQIDKEINSDDEAVIEYFENNAEDEDPVFANIFTKTGCVEHTLQLGINDWLLRTTNIRKIIVKAKKLAAKLRNPVITLHLRNFNFTKPIMSVDTRWNSVYYMLQRLQLLQPFCKEFSPTIKGLGMKQTFWESLKQIVTVLEPVSVLTTQLEEQNLSLPQFLQYWKVAMIKLEKNDSPYARQLRQNILKREKIIFSNDIINAAYFLDLRFNILLSSEKNELAKNFIEAVYKKILNINHTDANIEDDDSVESCNLEESMNDDEAALEEILQGAMSQNASTSQHKTTKITHHDEFKKELELFNKEKRLPLKTDIFVFWKMKNCEYPKLSQVAEVILTAPVTQVSVERLFAHLNFVLNKHRSTLSKDILEDIMLLRCNQKFNKK